MRFGICTSIKSADVVKAAGWDYIEVPAKELLDTEVEHSPLPVLAANLLVPATMKITGPDVNPSMLLDHLQRVTARAGALGLTTLVFGSGGARNIPDGFDQRKAREQLLDFSQSAAELATQSGITIALEPLNSGECNIIKSLPVAAETAQEIGLKSFGVTFDTYHFWVEGEPLDALAVVARLKLIRHVHVADKIGRVPPGGSGKSDYRPLFRILKASGYDSLISVEGDFPDDLIRRRGGEILAFLKTEWQESGSL